MDAGRTRLGVDFGTSNTVAVISVDGREPRPLLFDGSPLLPSAVCVDPRGRLLVGRDALHTGLARPESFEPHPKRLIDDGTVLLGGTEFPVEALIAAVLGRVVQEAARSAGGPVTEPVLTFPAAWGSRRQATLSTAAGSVLPGVRLVAEPLAAANRLLAVAGDRVPVGACALVYDFGAGTFDASVVRRTVTGFDVLGSEGLADSGGLDIDAAIVAHLGAALSGRDPAAWLRLLEPATLAERRAARQLWDNVRAGKEMLARNSATQIHVPLLDLEVPLGREELDRLAGPVLERTVQASRTVLAGSGVALGDLAVVFLAGGSSRLPAATTVLHRAFGIAPVVVDQPELVVAEGSLLGGGAGILAAGSVPAGSVQTGTARAARFEGARQPVPEPSARAAGSAWWQRRRLVALAGAAVALAVAVPVALVLGVGRADRDGSEGTDPGAGRIPAGGTENSTSASPTPPAASPTPSLMAGLDPCLVGTWQRTSSERTLQIEGVPRQFTGRTGVVETFRADGTGTLVFKAEPPGVAVINGVRWEEILEGEATFTYRVTPDGSLLYANPSAEGTATVTRNGRYNTGGKLTLSVKPVRYSCSEETLVGVTDFFSIQARRITPTT